MEQQLWLSAYQGRADEVAAVLRGHPDLDVNWENANDQKFTALHVASDRGHAEVVKLLLAHPGINVCPMDIEGSAPLHVACSKGKFDVVRVLLEDPRVDATLANYEGRTPLWWASYFGHHVVVKWLIASGRDLDPEKRGLAGNDAFTPLELAIKCDLYRVFPLLQSFMASPTDTRYQLRRELGLQGVMIAGHFATVVFLCDGLLQVKAEEKGSAAARFFTIAQRLPMELQMIIANRVMGSVKDSVLSVYSERAFRVLARVVVVGAQEEVKRK